MTEAPQPQKLTNALAGIAAAMMLVPALIAVMLLAAGLFRYPLDLLKIFLLAMVPQSPALVAMAVGIVCAAIALWSAARGHARKAILLVAAAGLLAVLGNIAIFTIYAPSPTAYVAPLIGWGLLEAAALVLAWRNRWLTPAAGALAAARTYDAVISAAALYDVIYAAPGIRLI